VQSKCNVFFVITLESTCVIHQTFETSRRLLRSLPMTFTRVVMVGRDLVAVKILWIW